MPFEEKKKTMGTIQYYTEEGLKRLKDELQEL
jgi:hypothetical protein